MKKAGVIGNPIKHSLSPFIHKYWLKKYAIDGTYEKFLVTKDEIFNFLKKKEEENFEGFNITVPHKEEILGYKNIILFKIK